MFTGSSTERKVSLAGRGQKNTGGREALLAGARVEREQREQQRLRERGALVVQRVWRSHAARCAWRQGCRALLEGRLADVQRLEGMVRAAGRAFAARAIAWTEWPTQPNCSGGGRSV